MFLYWTLVGLTPPKCAFNFTTDPQAKLKNWKTA